MVGSRYGESTREGTDIVMTCDYNGWNDSPEDEREWFDQHPEIWSVLMPKADTHSPLMPGSPTHRARRRS